MTKSAALGAALGVAIVIAFFSLVGTRSRGSSGGPASGTTRALSAVR